MRVMSLRSWALLNFIAGALLGALVGTVLALIAMVGVN